MPHIKEKVERRLGEKLFLKGERCTGPKCAATRRAYPPGVHGKRRTRRREGSEFGILLREKQKIRYLYGLDDKEIKRYSTIASARTGVFSVLFFRLLEGRLDNVVYRLGLAESRRSARQMVGHGHITVNGRLISAPSHQTSKGDVIALKERAERLGIAARITERLKKYEAPRWLSLDRAKKSGTISGIPETDATVMIDPTKIKEFYSR
ncbi:MAG: 30S ribosomal protein S4 [bacterium]|nr:30S ribosomal protein S4 [bacterium]MDZ4299547.1 30S ribosomal protein S4 [Candidatus Sungbacteria bacterium]